MDISASLPISPHLLPGPPIHWTWEVRVKIITDVVRKGQPPRAESKAKKCAVWVWGQTAGVQHPCPIYLCCLSKAAVLAIKALVTPCPLPGSLLFVIQPFIQASSPPVSLPGAPFCLDTGCTVEIVCSLEIGTLFSFSPLPPPPDSPQPSPNA